MSKKLTQKIHENSLYSNLNVINTKPTLISKYLYIILLLFIIFFIFPANSLPQTMDFNKTKIELNERYEVSTRYKSTESDHYIRLTQSFKNGKMSVILSSSDSFTEVEVPYYTISDVIWYSGIYYICPGGYGNYHLVKYESNNYEEIMNSKVSGKWTLKCDYFSGKKILNEVEIKVEEIVIQYIGTDKAIGYKLKQNSYENYSFSSYKKECFFYVGNNTGCDIGNSGYCGYELGITESNLNGQQTYFAITDSGTVNEGRTINTDKTLVSNFMDLIQCSISYTDSYQTVTILSYSNSSSIQPKVYRTIALSYSGTNTVSLDSSYEKTLNMPCDGEIKSMFFLNKKNYYKFEIECEGTLFWGIGDPDNNQIIYLSKEEVQQIEILDNESPSLLVLKDDKYYQICPFQLVNEKCSLCSDFTFINYNQPSSCIPSCSGENMIKNNNYCQCEEGYQLDSSNKCVKSCYELCSSCLSLGDSSSNKCTSCIDGYFLMEDTGNCMENCGDGFGVRDGKCVSCKSLGQFILSGKCIDECPSEYKPNIENECILNEIICINGIIKNGICECFEGYKGKTCNIKDIKEWRKAEVYIAKNEQILIQKDTIFSLNTDNDFDIQRKVNYVWEIYEKNSKIPISDEFFLNGKNERNLKVKKGAFNSSSYDNSYNKAYIAICHIYSEERGNTEAQLEFSVLNYIDLSKLKINLEAEQPFYSLNSTLKINLDMQEKTHNHSFYYQIYYKDIYNDILPLTDEYSLINKYELKIPYTESIIIYIKDVVGNIDKIEKSLGFKVKVKSSFSNLKDISNNEDMGKEAKLQQISNFLLDEDKNASNEDIKNSINTIHKMVVNSNDTFEFNRKMLSAVNQIISYETSEKDTTTESSNLLDVTNLLGNIVNKINKNNNADINIDKDNITNDNDDDDNNDNDKSQILTEIFRNADSILGKSIKIIGNNNTINLSNNTNIDDNNDTSQDNNTNKCIAQAIENTKMLIDTSNLLYANELVEGESIFIKADNYENFIIKPGKDKNTIAITENNDNNNINDDSNINKYEPQSLNNNDDNNHGKNKGRIRILTKKDKPELSKKSEKEEEDPCLENQSTNIFCMNQKEIIRAQNELSLTYNLVQNKIKKLRNLQENGDKNEFKAANISLGVLKSNKALQYKSLGYNPITEDTILTNIYADFYENNDKKSIKSSYNRLRNLLEESNIDKEQDINPSPSTSNLETLLHFTVSMAIRDKEQTRELAPNSTCLSFKSLKKASSQCKTLFDYKKNRVVCKCIGSGDFSAVYDYALSNLNKLIQYPTLNWDIINPFVVCFISSTLLIIFVFCTILLIIDWCEDRRKEELTLQEKFAENYIEDHSIGTSNIFTLGWLCTSFSYPYLSVFYLYAYNQPRFFRLLIQMFSVLVSMIFSSLPYYQVSEFKYRTEFVDERDIEKESWDVNNLPTRFLDWLSSLVYSFIASICVSLVVKVFTYFLRFKQLLNKTWMDKLNLLKKYISYKQLDKIRKKKEREKFKKFLTNLLAYLYITEVKKNSNNDYNKDDDDELISSPPSQFSASKNVAPIILSDGLGIVHAASFSATETQPFISFHEENEMRKIRKILGKERGSKFERGSSIRGIEEIKNNEKSNKNIDNRNRSDSHNKLISENNNINIRHRNNELISCSPEENKNKHDLNKENIIDTNEKVRVKQTQKNQLITSKTKFKKEYVGLKKGGKHILTILGNDIDNFLDFFNEDESEQKCKEIKQMCLTVLFTFILLLLFTIIYYYIANIFTYLYNTYSFYIIKAWLFPTLLNITIIRLFTSYGKNVGYLMVIFLLNKHKNKNLILKLLFKYFIPKYMVSMYEIRELIQEYQIPLKEEFLKISK